MSSDDSQKLWLQPLLNQIAAGVVAQHIQGTGRALPCQVVAVEGSIVTVTFEVTVPYTTPQGLQRSYTLPPVTIPKAESQWIRTPTQVGDYGITIPVDASIIGVSSALPGGTAVPVAQVGVENENLTNLCFIAIGSSGFIPIEDQNKAYVSGPNGFTLQDPDGVVSIVGDKLTGTITITAGTQTIVITQDPSVTTTVQGSLGQLQTIVDGEGNAISHIVPLAGGKIFLGGQGLGAVNAALSQGNLSAFATGAGGLIENTLPKLMAAVGGAIGATSSTWSDAQPLLATIFAAADFVSGISGINPTIPTGSTTVFIRP